jgi:nucleoside-diphosphate-sugar epimerase
VIKFALPHPTLWRTFAQTFETNVMKILLIGCGFIGRHFLNAATSAGHQLTVLDHRTHNNHSQLCEEIMGDVRDKNLMATVIPEFECVVNLAGVLGTSETICNPLPSVETNLLGALNVFEAVRSTSGQRRRTRCVQITVGNYFMNNSYAITKSSAERFALMYNREHNTQIAIVRALNAYGPHQKHIPVRKIIPNFIVEALNGHPITIYGTGEQVMDMIYVEDVANILLRVVIAKELDYGRAIEAGTARRTTVNQIAQIVLAITGSTAGVKYMPMRSGEPLNSEVVADPSSLHKLGVDVGGLVQLEVGLRATVSWYRENYPWQTQ